MLYYFYVKHYLKFLVIPFLVMSILSLMVSLSYSIISYPPVSADTVPPATDSVCGTGFLSVDSNYNNCGITNAPLGPIYSDLKVSIFAVAMIVLVVLATVFANKRYFAKFNEKSRQKLLFATIFGILLLLAATMLVPGYVNSAWDDNWISKVSGEALTLLAFVPSFAVLGICLAKARQYKQRKLSMVQLLLVTAAAYLTFDSILRIIWTYPN